MGTDMNEIDHQVRKSALLRAMHQRRHAVHFGDWVSQESSVKMEAQRVKIVDGGKLVIPAAMRRELGITTGDTVLVDVDDGELRVRSVPRALERARAILRRYVPEGVGLADELIAERRREAERE